MSSRLPLAKRLERRQVKYEASLRARVEREIVAERRYVMAEFILFDVGAFASKPYSQEEQADFESECHKHMHILFVLTDKFFAGGVEAKAFAMELIMPMTWFVRAFCESHTILESLHEGNVIAAVALMWTMMACKIMMRDPEVVPLSTLIHNAMKDKLVGHVCVTKFKYDMTRSQ